MSVILFCCTWPRPIVRGLYPIVRDLVLSSVALFYCPWSDFTHYQSIFFAEALIYTETCEKSFNKFHKQFQRVFSRT
jgi:hypothetical protein